MCLAENRSINEQFDVARPTVSVRDRIPASQLLQRWLLLRVLFNF